MPIPELMPNGTLPPGIHAATLTEIVERYGAGSEARGRQARLLQLIVDSALNYPTIKRILVWGSFVMSKAEPNDLDFSIVVPREYDRIQIEEPHRRFFVPYESKQFYGTDTEYLLIHDYPLPKFSELMDFICGNGAPQRGIIEINLCCENRSE